MAATGDIHAVHLIHCQNNTYLHGIPFVVSGNRLFRYLFTNLAFHFLQLISGSVRRVILDAKVGFPLDEKEFAKDLLSIVSLLLLATENEMKSKNFVLGLGLKRERK